MSDIRPGNRVEVLTALGDWKPATALSRIEGTHDYSKSRGGRKIHDFPVVWIGFDGNPRPTPWPVTTADGEPAIRRLT